MSSSLSPALSPGNRLSQPTWRPATSVWLLALWLAVAGNLPLWLRVNELAGTPTQRLALLGGFWWYLKNLITGPLDGLIRAANSMAAGDLTQSVAHTRSDQLSQSCQTVGNPRSWHQFLKSPIHSLQRTQIPRIRQLRSLCKGNSGFLGQTPWTKPRPFRD